MRRLEVFGRVCLGKRHTSTKCRFQVNIEGSMVTPGSKGRDSQHDAPGTRILDPHPPRTPVSKPNSDLCVCFHAAVASCASLSQESSMDLMSVPTGKKGTLEKIPIRKLSLKVTEPCALQEKPVQKRGVIAHPQPRFQWKPLSESTISFTTLRHITSVLVAPNDQQRTRTRCYQVDYWKVFVLFIHREVLRDVWLAHSS